MNIDRMRILERVMMDVIEQGRPFDMGMWEVETRCETVCCAGGWLCRDPQAQEQGLELWNHEPHMVDAYDQQHWGFSALEVWFGIEHSESYDLFSVVGYRMPHRDRRPIPPGEVLRKVRRYIRGRRA